jgi:predicted NBD/HSP70 family sugar kinase/transcriptional regulator with XRE-family HTH domain
MSADGRRESGTDELEQLLSGMGPTAAAAFEDATRRTQVLRELIEWRKSRRLSQTVVAEAMDTTQSAVSELETRGSDPRLSTLQRYARAVGKKLHVGIADRTNPDDQKSNATVFDREALPRALESGVGGVLTDLLRGYTHGSRTLDQLVEHTDLPKAMVVRAVDRLSNYGWVATVGDAPDRAPLITLNADRALVTGVSIRGDYAYGVVTNLRAETPLVTERRELASGDANAVVAEVASLVSSLTSGLEGDREVIGLGVEIAALVDPELGIVRFAPDLEPHSPQWRNFPLQAELEAATGLRTVVENDANALAVHEYLRRGDTSDLMVVLIGDDGIGAGLIHNGELLHGVRGISGEIGHVVVDPDGRSCRDVRQRGCLETVASHAAILRAIAETGRREDTGVAADRAQEYDGEVLEAYGAGGRELGRVLATLTTLLAPSEVVIYGPPELTERNKHLSAQEFVYAAKECLDNGWFTQFGYKADIATRELDPTAGARGAASVAVSKFLDRPLRWLAPKTGHAEYSESVLARAT